MKKHAKKILLIVMMLMMATSLCAKKKQTEVRQVKKMVYLSSIVVFSDAAAEFLTAMGATDLIVAISEEANIFPEDSDVAVIPLEDQTISTILDYEPDFVFITDGVHRDLEDELDDYEIKWYEFYAETIDELKDQILEVGKLMNHSADSRAIVEGMDDKLAKLQASVDSYYSTNEKKKVYFEIAAEDDSYTVLGARTFFSEALEKAGGQNLFDYINSDSIDLVGERIIEKEPEVILIAADSGTTVEDVMNRPGWENLPAVQNGKIFIIDTAAYTKLAPSCVDAIYELFELLK